MSFFLLIFIPNITTSRQVFNSLWYPNFEYDIPLLGVDLISLGKSRVLSVIDFQPLHATEEYSSKYISHLTQIRAKYPGNYPFIAVCLSDGVVFI